MKKFWVLLALAAMVAAGCKSGKKTEVKDEVGADSTSLVADSVGTRVALNDIRFKGWTKKEWLDNDYIRTLRKYIDDYNEGKVSDVNLDPYREKIRCKFIVYDIEAYMLGGVLLRVLFLDLPDTVFSAWIYSYVDEETKTVEGYEMRSIMIEEEKTDCTREDMLQAVEEVPELKLW